MGIHFATHAPGLGRVDAVEADGFALNFDCVAVGHQSDADDFEPHGSSGPIVSFGIRTLLVAIGQCDHQRDNGKRLQHLAKPAPAPR
jgi:hypothetical protein